jgi:uncharacterized protein (DUF488 family)
MIFTIGHGRHPADHFADLLLAHRITLLADVRSHPVSRWAPQFNRAALTQSLLAHGITYTFLGRELGGRPKGEAFYRPDGTLDPDRRAAAPEFQDGIAQLLELARAHRTVVLCAEEDPTRCHRSTLIAPALRHVGVEVTHLRGDGRVETSP